MERILRHFDHLHDVSVTLSVEKLTHKADANLHAAMTALKVSELEVSPWALREGVLLRYTESMSWG